MIEVTNEIHKDVKKEFMSKFDRYEPVILDHTAIIAAKQCLRKYFNRFVLGRTVPEDAIYFAWGSSYHKFREILELTYGIGDNKPAKFDEAKAMEAMLAATNAGLGYWQRNGVDQQVTDKFNWMTKHRLFLSFKVAFEYWKQEKQRNIIEVIAVEQPFNIQLKDGSYRSGKADQIVRWNNKVWGRDFKTTSKDSVFYQRNLDPNEQFSGYTFSEKELSGEQVQGQIVELLYNARGTKSGEKGPEIISLIASRTTWQLEQWEKDTIFWTDIIRQAREKDHYPMSEVGCSFCEFHQVCKQSNEAAMMYQLESSYKLSPWDNQKLGEQ